MGILRVAVCLATLLLAACSLEAEKPTGGQAENRTTAVAKPGSPAYAEYSAEHVLLRRGQDVLDIEEARLQRTGREDGPEVVVRVNVPAEYENCLLMRESAWLDLERSFENDDVPERLVFEHPWGRRTLKEEYITGDEIVVIFRESSTADTEPTDVSAVPLYALCYTQVAPSGANAEPTTWYDASPVEGTFGRRG